MQSLSRIEAREFMDEFISHVFIAINKKEERKKEIELRKSKLIERQFPGLKRAERPVPAIPVKAPPKVIHYKPVKIGVEKVDTLLADPSIDLIECSDGSIRIRKKGNMQETGFMMNERETEDVINKFSVKTKIPIMDKFLHASLDNVKIDAIISELIGSRFLITKKRES